LKNEKMMALALLDACAFACTQDSREETRKEFEMACEFAGKLSLGEVKSYQDLVASYDREKPGRKRSRSKRSPVTLAGTESSSIS